MYKQSCIRWLHLPWFQSSMVPWFWVGPNFVFVGHDFVELKNYFGMVNHRYKCILKWTNQIIGVKQIHPKVPLLWWSKNRPIHPLKNGKRESVLFFHNFLKKVLNFKFSTKLQIPHVKLTHSKTLVTQCKALSLHHGLFSWWRKGAHGSFGHSIYSWKHYFPFFLVSKIWKEFNKKLAKFVKSTLKKQKFPKQTLVFLSKNGKILPKQKKHYSKRISCP